MSRLKLVVVGCLFVPAACGTEAPEQEAVDTPETPTMELTPGPAFLALHRYNPVSDELNERLLADLASLNQAVADAGQPETGYQVWKVTGEQTGDHGYIIGSIWADRATYDAVHEHEAYTTAMAAIATLPSSRISRNCRKPLPRSPSKFSAGIRQSSSRTS